MQNVKSNRGWGRGLVDHTGRAGTKREDIGGAVVETIAAYQIDDHGDKAVVTVKTYSPWPVIFVPHHYP